MNKFKRLPIIGCAVVLSAVLSGCGGGGSSSGSASLRLVNATLTHPSLDLLVNTSVAASKTAADNASAYVAAGSGTDTLQINDAGAATALVSSTRSLTQDLHYTLVAYESGGAVKTAVLTEDFAAPIAGTAQLRIYDTATDAGALDVYITDPTTDLAGVASPTLSITADLFAASSGLLVYSPGTYRVRVTGAGKKSDLRVDMPVTLASLQIGTVVLTPASGGLLLNGSTLIQQSTYAATRNATARVRLVAAVSGGSSVSAMAGAAVIDAGTVSPAVDSYVVVPAAGALSVSVGGIAIAAPAAGLTAGSDATLLVYTNPATAATTASLIADDNRRPSVSTNVKMRLVNGVTGTATTLALAANFTSLATGVAPGAASAYGLVASSTAMRLDVTSPLKPSFYTAPSLNIFGDSVYTMFMLGDFGTPQAMLSKDR